MDRLWITNGSTSVEPIVNSLTAACDRGYLPTDIYVLDNPEIVETTASASTLAKTAVTAYDGDEPTVTVETIEDELDFEAIIDYLQSAIEAGQDTGADIAVDVTPGRKFWSIISFRAGFHYDVDHIYYVRIPDAYFGELYPTIPRTALELVDFTEVF